MQWKADMSYLSQQFIEICDQCSDTILCDTTLDEVLLNEAHYMAPKRYYLRRRGRLPETIIVDGPRENEDYGKQEDRNSKDSKRDQEKGWERNISSSEDEEITKRDESEGSDEEFYDDEDVRGLESELQLDLTSKLRKNVGSSYPTTSKVTIQARDDKWSSTQTLRKPATKRAKSPEARFHKRKAETDLGSQDNEPVTYILTNWFPQFTSKLSIFIEGDLVSDSSGLSVKNERKNSSSIKERIDSCTLCSKSGNIYKLKGPIDSKMASKYGISEGIIKNFRNGFPKNWKDFITKQPRVVLLRKDVSVIKSKMTEDNSNIKINNYKEKQKTTSSKGKEKGTEQYENDDSLDSESSLSPSNYEQKRHIDVDNLPRTRSGRIVFPRLDFWRQERLLTFKNKTLFISVNPSGNEHNATILTETIQEPSTKERAVSSKKCDQPKEEMLKKNTTKRAKMDKEAKEDDESRNSRSTLRAKEESLKNVSAVKPIVLNALKVSPELFSPKLLRSRTLSNNGRERKTVSSEGVVQKSTKSNDLHVQGSVLTVRSKRGRPSKRKQDMDVIPEEQPVIHKTVACKRPLQKEKSKQTSSKQKRHSYSKDDVEIKETEPTNKESTNLIKENTDYKVTAKPGTLLFKSQVRNLLTLNSQCDDDDDFTNSTPYRNKKRFKLHGMRLDDDDDADDDDSDDGYDENNIKTPHHRVPYLIPVSAKKTPALYKSMVTPHSPNVDRKMIDRYIRNRKKGLKPKGKSSKMSSSNYETPRHPSKTQTTQIDSNCLRFPSPSLFVQDDGDDEDSEEQDYYFSDDDTE